MPGTVVGKVIQYGSIVPVEGNYPQGHALNDSGSAERAREKGCCGNETTCVVAEVDLMCIQCVNDIDNMPRNHPNHDRYVRDIRANCPYPWWKRLRDERRKKRLAKGHEARKSTVHLRSQCFFNNRGGLVIPGSRSHHTNIARLRFKERHGL